jgi:hypothetical protein
MGAFTRRLCALSAWQGTRWRGESGPRNCSAQLVAFFVGRRFWYSETAPDFISLRPT